MTIETYEIKCTTQFGEWYMGYHIRLANYVIIWHSCKAFKYNYYYNLTVGGLTYCLKCKTQFPEIVIVTANLIK
jgi:hypothetical protein